MAKVEEKKEAPPPAETLLSQVRKTAVKLPDVITLHGLEGAGKTTFGAGAEKPVFICTRAETGLDTLISNKRVPETEHFPILTKWSSILLAVEELRTQPHDFKNLVIDTANGAEAMLADGVRAKEFGNSGSAYASYGKGSQSVIDHWRTFIYSLATLREQRRMGLISLIHSVKKAFNDPTTGAEYDRWEPALVTKYQAATTWGIVNGFSDLVFFLGYNDDMITDSTTGKERPKANSESLRRVLYTERRPAFDAKNRYGMPPKMDLGSDPADLWAQIREFQNK